MRLWSNENAGQHISEMDVARVLNPCSGSGMDTSFIQDLTRTISLDN